MNNLWAVYHFPEYFRREILAVFFDSSAAIDFALTEKSYGNGCYIGEYRKGDNL
jgi:hypothetical protein